MDEAGFAAVDKAFQRAFGVTAGAMLNEMIGNGLALGGQPDVPATLHKRIEGHRGGILKWGERATVFIGGHAGFAHRCARKYSG